MAINLDPWLADTTQTEGRYSFNQWVLDGSHVNFGINFQGVAPGYLSRDHVKYYINDENGLIVVAATVVPSDAWQSDSVIQIMDGADPYPAGYTLSIYRDSPKDQPIPNFEDGSIMDEENLDEGFRQAIYVAAEMVDRFGVSQDQSQAAIDKANEAIDTANTTLSTANTALSTANTASSNASAAVTTANAAQAAAAAAVTTANGIDAKATTALNNSDTAVSTANTALSTANGIDAKAQTALDNSAAAVTAAGNAVATAGTANATANAANATANGIAATANTALTNANAAVTTANNVSQAQNAMQCYLSFAPSTVTLQSYRGNTVTVNGVQYKLPSTGVALTVAGLTANTDYYVYLYYTGSALAMEFSTTGYEANSTTGMHQKIGDATRMLVGRTTAASATTLYLIRSLSFYNRRKRAVIANFNGQGINSTTPTAIAAVTIASWSDEIVEATYYGYWTPNVACAISIIPAIDGANIAAHVRQISYGTGAAAFQALSYAVAYDSGFGLTEGQHTFSCLAAQITSGSGGTANGTQTLVFYG